MPARTETVTDRRERILCAVNDLASCFLYYDRKGDEDLPINAIEEAIEAGEVSIDAIVGAFRDEIERAYDHRAANKRVTPSSDRMQP